MCLCKRKKKRREWIESASEHIISSGYPSEINKRALPFPCFIKLFCLLEILILLCCFTFSPIQHLARRVSITPPYLPFLGVSVFITTAVCLPGKRYSPVYRVRFLYFISKLQKSTSEETPLLRNNSLCLFLIIEIARSIHNTSRGIWLANQEMSEKFRSSSPAFLPSSCPTDNLLFWGFRCSPFTNCNFVYVAVTSQAL